MAYRPTHPETPEPGEPYSPEPATHPDTDFEAGSHHFVSLVPAAPEEDEDILLSIKQGFDREHIQLQTPHDFAAASLREFLDKHGISDSPDDLLLTTLYLHLVNERPGPWRAQVAHSMTLTQALIANWQQEGSGSLTDHLGFPKPWRSGGYEVSETVELSYNEQGDSWSYDAIYRRTDAQTYGAATQIELDPAVLRAFIWDAKLQGHYLEYLRHFWSNHGADYPIMFKGNLVHAALLQRDEKSLSAEHAALVLKSMMLSPDTSWENTSFQYFADNPVSTKRTLSSLKIYGFEATDILVFAEHGSDHTVLYIPGNSSPLHGFANMQELRDWFTQQCRDPRKRAALASHFSSKDRKDGFFSSGVNTALDGLAVHPRRLNDSTGHWYPASTITVGDALFPSPFEHISERIRQRMFSDADYDIGTQGKYYRRVLGYGMELAANVVGAIALAVPVLTPVAVALGVGLVVVGAGEMITAHDREEQVEGAQRLAFGLLNALPLLGEVSQLTAVKATLSATQRAPAEASEAEHAAQLVADTALEGVQGEVPDTFEEFKVVRPVHDTLPDYLKGQLKDLAIDRPVTVVGGGKGTFLDDGKLYVRIRPQVYRVQWLEHEQQLRIRSEGEPVVWGPFLRSMDSGYWDIDLRFGLRGGTTPVTVLEHAPLPSEVIDGIASEPLVPKVETSFAVDDLIWSHENECYEADIVLTHDDLGEKFDEKVTSRQPVWYDADAAAWRRFATDHYIWRESYGRDGAIRWRAGSAKDFARVRHRLPFEQNISEYRFPDLPQIPVDAAPIANEIHMIWVGEKELNYMIKRNILKNTRNKHFKFILHLDCDEVALQANQAWCEQIGIESRNLREQPYFNAFIADAQGAAYNYFRNPVATSRNYAAASDYLRLRLIDENGGIYMDVDDVLLTPDPKPLLAAPEDVLVGGQYRMPWNKQMRVNTSHFASHPGNPVLKRLLREAADRFDKLPDTFKNSPRPVVRDFTSKAEAERVMNAYMQTISDLAGPDAFNKGMKAIRPNSFGLIQRQQGWVHSQVYEEFYEAALEHWFPLRMGGSIGAQPGSAHTWMHT
ncbi:MAG: DUF6543 domain-containing protein [Pseudomonas farsensis]|uniref:dermonecrotic toxin domain-containing protein n=1 Tax=Pseudomonas farsensis TaxID=2745492 RepID=UPI003C79B834